MLRQPLLGRVATAMVTPFNSRLEIDEESVLRLTNHLITHGSESLVVCGTTGESATLSHDEKVRLFRLVRSAAGSRAKVIAGVGTNNTAETIVLSEVAQAIGMDGLLVVAPYYNRPSQDGLYAHFSSVAASTKLPVILYNVPARTAVNIEAATAARLATSCPNIVAIKDANTLLAQVSDVIAASPKGFEVYSGEDATALPLLALGGVGVVSVSSHVVGDDVALMHKLFFDGDIEGARRIHYKILPITKALFMTSNPVPVKAALAQLGVIAHGIVRQPLVQATDREEEAIRVALTNGGLL